MKYITSRANTAFLIACTLLWIGSAAAREDDQSERSFVVTTQTLGDNDDPPALAPAPDAPAEPAAPAMPADIVIQSVEPDGKGKPGKVVAWLGVAVEEASEALSSQLGLKPGEGLTVTLLAEGSPAEKADLHKNDVLVEIDGQMLVHPLQLRKLVRMHAEGDTVKLIFYRAGKKQTASVKLAKTNLEAANDMNEISIPGDLQSLGLQLKGGLVELKGLKDMQGLKDLETLNLDLRGMKESLARAGLDKDQVNVEVKRTMEQTRKALRDAMRTATIDRKSLTAVDRELEDLARDGVDVDKDATVTIRSKRDSSRTIVETDDNGSYIIVAGAKTHLTAHDQHGKLLFEGDIDTPAEQEKVPREVWEKAKPMFDQIAAPRGNEPREKIEPEHKPNSRNKTLARVSFQCA